MSKATAVRGASVKRSTAAQRATAPQRSLVVRERRTTRRANDAMARAGTGIGIIAPRARMIARGARARGRGRGRGRSYPKRVLRARETDARRERLTVIRTLYDDS